MAKVRFGFKNVYYAPITKENNNIVYGNPVKLDGAVSMSLNASGDKVEFYADDGLYFSDNANNGYEGSLEFALIPQHFKSAILNEVVDNNGVAVEDATKITNPFALLCEFTQDDGNKKFVFYHCTASRPAIEASTKGETKEIKTETLDIVCRPDANGIVKRSTTDTTDSTVINNWYSSVYEGEISA